MSESNRKIEVEWWVLVECERAFRALFENKNSYVHKVFTDDLSFICTARQKIKDAIEQKEA